MLNAYQNYRQSLTNYGLEDSNVVSQLTSLKESALAQHLQTFEDVKDKVADIAQVGMDVAQVAGFAKFGMFMKKIKGLTGKDKTPSSEDAPDETSTKGGAEETQESDMGGTLDDAPSSGTYADLPDVGRGDFQGAEDAMTEDEK